MQLEIRLASATKLDHGASSSSAQSAVYATFGIGHICSFETTVRRSSRGKVVWNEAFLVSRPVVEEHLTLKVVMWEVDLAQDGTKLGRRCLGIIKHHLLECIDRGFSAHQLHPRATKRGPPSRTAAGSVTFAIHAVEPLEVPLSSGPNPSTAHIAPLLLPVTVLVHAIDLLSWRNALRTFLLATVSWFGVQYRMYDAAIGLLGLASLGWNALDVRAQRLVKPQERYGQDVAVFDSLSAGRRFRLYGIHCRCINAAIRAIWWASAGCDQAALAELASVAKTAMSSVNSSRLTLALSWILYIVVGSDTFITILFWIAIVIFPLYLRTASIVGRHSAPTSVPYTMVRLIHVTSDSGRTARSRSVDDRSDGEATFRNHSLPPASSREMQVSPEMSHAPPTPHHIRQRRQSVTARRFAIVVMDLMGVDIEEALQKQQIFYDQLDNCTSYDTCTKSAVSHLKRLHMWTKAFHLFLSSDGSLEEMATEGAAEGFWKGITGFEQSDTDPGIVYHVQSRLKSSWLVEAGEGAELASSVSANLNLPSVLLRVRAKPGCPSSTEALVEAKAFALVASYFLQGRKLALYQNPQLPSRMIFVVPLTSTWQPNFNMSTPCPKPLREAMETVWRCEPTATAVPRTPLECNDATFTTDTVVAMLESYQQFWEANITSEGSFGNLSLDRVMGKDVGPPAPSDQSSKLTRRSSNTPFNDS